MRAFCDKYIKKPCLRTESADFGIDIGVVDAHWLTFESLRVASRVSVSGRGIRGRREEEEA